MIYGAASFPGIEQIQEATMVLTDGIRPSSARLTIVPQNHFTAAVGSLTFSDGQRFVRFDDCMVDSTSFERNHHGLVWRLQILDRRWKWTKEGGGGQVSGYYNIPNGPSGVGFGSPINNPTFAPGDVTPDSLIESTRKSARELVGMCFDAIGESNYDASIVPDGQFPPVEWDKTLPAEALAQLCELFGLQIVLGFADRVKICRKGEGVDLPISDNIQSNSLSLKLPALPDKITLVLAPDRFQIYAPLYPVGIDTDGTIKDIDLLSYKPQGGWARDSLPKFPAVLQQSGQFAQWLAEKSVFKWYRVWIDDDHPLTVGGSPNAHTVTEPWTIRLEPTQIHLGQDAAGTTNNLPCFVFGLWCPEKTANGWQNVQDYVRVSYDIDIHNHVVKFSRPVFAQGKLVGQDFRPVPAGQAGNPALWQIGAVLYLATACTLLDPQTHEPVRYEYEYPTGGTFGTPTRYDSISEVLSHIPKYGEQWYPQIKTGQDGWPRVERETTGEQTDLESLRPRLDAYLSGIFQEYRNRAPQIINYAGIMAIEPDGAIQNIQYHVTQAGCSTTISRNGELFHIARRGQREFTRKARQAAIHAERLARLAGYRQHRGGR